MNEAFLGSWKSVIFYNEEIPVLLRSVMDGTHLDPFVGV